MACSLRPGRRHANSPGAGPRERRGRWPVTAQPADVRQRARIGALRKWASTEDRVAATAAARAAFMRRFEVEVDPRGRLDPVDRAQRAEYARRAYMVALA